MVFSRFLLYFLLKVAPKLWYNSGIFLAEKMSDLDTSFDNADPEEASASLATELADTTNQDTAAISNFDALATAPPTLEEQIAELNHPDIPTPETVKTFEEGEATWEALLDELGKDEWDFARIVEIFLGVWQGKGNKSRGVGVYAAGVAEIDNKSLATLVQRFEANQPNGAGWRAKLEHGVLTHTAQLELLSRGYDVPNAAPLSTEKNTVLEVGENKTLKDMLDPEIWNQLHSEEVIGPMFSTDTLPKGAFLHLSEEGYPLGLTAAKTEAPPKRLLVKQLPETPPNLTAAMAEYAKSQLQPGDIVIANHRQTNEKNLQQYFRTAVDALGDADFVALHMMVYVGNGHFAEIMDRGKGQNAGAIVSVEDILNRYGGMVAMRPPNGQEIAQAAQKNIQQVTTYNTPGLVVDSWDDALFGSDVIDLFPNEGEKGVCWDVLRGTEFYEHTPQEIFEQLPLTLALNMEPLPSKQKKNSVQ